MKEGLQVFVESNRTTKAIIIGTRKSDPFGYKMTPFQKTDGDWPAIMRVHPILDWDYHDVWKVMFALNIPYCILYDQGYFFVIENVDTFRYTSLGDVHNTLPNPNLKRADGSYDPAYKLIDGSSERAGRI